MDKSLYSGTHEKLETSESMKFSRAFSRSKLFGTVAAAIWGFGLIEVALADIFTVSWRTSVICSTGIVGILALVAYVYYRGGMRTSKAAGSCSAASGEHGCSQEGCDRANGGCLGNFDSEISVQIARMEKEKLSLLLRRKIGVEMILPLFWLVVGVKLTMSSSIASIWGGMALLVGSIGLIATRLYLGTAVFS
ncbi:MAG: hypothetical protein EPN30_00280 [Actinomycetota bacterium]|nr:MAG: hypothetical protein EPN30_00280 [Actinomycetota bacterium]